MARKKFSIPARVTRTSLNGRTRLIYADPIEHARDFQTPGTCATVGRPVGWLNDRGIFQRYGTGEIMALDDATQAERSACIETAILVRPAVMLG